MNMSLLKLIVMLSAFIGIIAGIFALIPYVGGFAFFVLICLSAVIEMGFLMKLEILKLESVQESAVIGSLIGFLSFIGFSFVYMPLVVILSKTFNYYVNYGVALALNNSSAWVIILVSLFMAVLSATVNAFAGILTFYASEFLKDMKNRQ